MAFAIEIGKIKGFPYENVIEVFLWNYREPPSPPINKKREPTNKKGSESNSTRFKKPVLSNSGKTKQYSEAYKAFQEELHVDSYRAVEHVSHES